MKQSTFLMGIITLSMALLLAAPAVIAQEAAPAVIAQEKDPLVGDWLLASDFNGRPISSMLMVSKDKEGHYQGSWVNFWGINRVDDLKLEDGKVSFTQTNRFRDQEMTFDFAGTITDGKLKGTMTGDQWENDFEGTQIKPVDPIVGVWEFRRQRQDREFVSTLTVSQDNDGKFTADWQSQRENAQDNPWEISDVKLEDGKLSFTRKSTNPDRQFEMTYTLTAEGDTISGTMTTPRGERQIEGKRLHGDLIGKWELTLTSDFGERKQLLWIKPDMTTLYGTTNVGKISVEDGTISFNYTFSFGDRSFENNFKSRLEAGVLTGEITNPRGTEQVKGTKIALPKE